MKITINHISFWHAMQKQPSWAIKYHADRRKRWPHMFKYEEKRNRLKVHGLIPLEHKFDKDFHIQNLMTLLSHSRERGQFISELFRLSVEHQGEQERRLCKRWLKKIFDRSWKPFNYTI